jgi:phycocyanobilin:ferredoxin oxidoreductase
VGRSVLQHPISGHGHPNLTLQIAKIAHPVPPSQRRRLAALHSAHERYCCKQLDNDKTRRVLEAAFGAELSEQYMREIMFDCEQLPAGA